MSSRLTDPDDHFPYKRGDALAALATPPAAGTRNHPEHWYTSEEIIAASDAYIDAQAALLAAPGKADVAAAYAEAKQALLDARAAHRVGRVGFTIGADLTGV
jgi:hypothetical protein